MVGGETEFVILGRVTGFHGVQGWIKVHSDTEPRENIVDFSHWWLVKPGASPESGQKIKVTGGKRLSKNVIARLQDVTTREIAAPLVGLDIAVRRGDLPALGNNEYYWTDLVGCEVRDTHGQVFGPVSRLFETGANDVLVVKDERADNNSPGGEILVPWVQPSVIREVKLATGQDNDRYIIVDWDPDY